jgi:hypothetical protein
MDHTEAIAAASGTAPKPKQAASGSKVVRLLGAVVLALAIVVALLAVIVALEPAEFRVARTAVISAPAADVFAHVNNLRQWEAWSPWSKIDPAMTQSYEGAAEGVGAIYNWSGNFEVGSGRTTITESRPNELIRIKLEMFEPMAGTSDARFDFKPEGASTRVTWTIEGRNGFVAKAFSLLMDMDQMIGEQFEKGLASLKTVVESQ